MSKKDKGKFIQLGQKEIEKAVQDADVYTINYPVYWNVSIYEGEEKYNKDLAQFSIPQRYAHAIFWYQSEVNNGGHSQFYYNSTGIVWKDALDGLKAIGHQKAYDILKKSVERFGNEDPSFDSGIRDKQLDDIQEDFDDLDTQFFNIEDLDNVLLNYIKQNIENFYFEGIVIEDF